MPAKARAAGILAGLVCMEALFFFGQFFLVGGTALRKKADCIIVMGAGVMPGGVPSLSMNDRTLKGCELLKDGWSDAIIFTGGPSEHGVSEPALMREIAAREGVPVGASVLDEQGRSTHDTVISARKIMARRGWSSAIVVSHDYHLSRTRLAFHRGGMQVSTWPAKRSRFTFHDVYIVMREAAAWRYYYFRPLWDSLRRE